MRELQLESLHADGEHLVLVDGEGQRYLLVIDEPLRVAVRRDRPHLEALRAAERSPLSPREIQARIRAGASVEEVAAAGGVALEAVRRFEGPVQAERTWIVQQTRALAIGHEVGAPTLGDLVLDRLAARGVESEAEWDALRRAGEPWEVSVTFTAGGAVRRAAWHVDLQARSITALDDESRWLSETDLTTRRPRGATPFDVEADEHRRGADLVIRDLRGSAGSTGPAGPAAAAGSGADGPSVGSTAGPQPGERGRPTHGAAAAEDVPGADPAAHAGAADDGGAASATDSLLAELTARRGRRGHAARDDGAADDGDERASSGGRLEPGDPDDPGDSRSPGLGGTADDAPAEEGLFPVPPVLRLRRAAADSTTGASGAESGSGSGSDDTAATAEDPAAPAAPVRGKSRSRRTSVPSWDEIVFGSRSD